MSEYIKTWIAILLLPALPVIVFYVLFKEQNYFGLSGFFKGIVGIGPIAAYVFLVWIGYVILIRISKLPVLTNPAAKNLAGRWRFVSTSSHGVELQGTCYIKYERGLLTLNGVIEDSGKPVGQWNSVIATTYENRLLIQYYWREIKEGKEERLDGLCSFVFGDAPITEISGNWCGAGGSDAIGTIKLLRITDQRGHFI
jgi:hypothetical protein